MTDVTQVAGAIILRDGCVLVARRAQGQKMAGLWEFPGGKLEPGESAASCIERELAEELGIFGQAQEVITSNLHRYPGGAIELIAVRVTTEMKAWNLTVHDEVRWADQVELLSLDLAPADIPIAHTICTMLADTSPIEE